jgi:hypothetical protein
MALVTAAVTTEGSVESGIEWPIVGGKRSSNLHARTLALNKTCPEQRGSGSMVDLSGNTDRLRVVMKPAFTRLGPEQRQPQKEQMDRMQVVTRQMVQVAGSLSDPPPAAGAPGTR